LKVLSVIFGLTAAAWSDTAVSGRVMNALTGQPIRKATVQMARIGGDARVPRPQVAAIQTNAEGVFRFDSIPPGSYRLSAYRTGFVRSAAVTVDPSRPPSNLTFTLTPAAIVAGTVLDPDGDPVEGATVHFLRPAYVNGRRRWSQASGTNTNDLGEYRMSGLPAGRYVVGVSKRSRAPGRPPGRGPETESPRLPDQFVPVYFPTAGDPASASPIVLKPGSELRGIDFRLRKSRVFRIRGTVAGMTAGSPAPAPPRPGPMRGGPPGRGPSGVVFLHSNSNSPGDEPRSAPLSPDGAFELTNVLPGAYLLVAQQGGRNAQPLYGRLPVTVTTDDILGVQLALQARSKVTARVTFEGAEPPPARFDLSFLPLELPESNPGRARLAPGSGIVETGLEANRYLLRAESMPEGFYLKSARTGDVDLLENALTVTAANSAQIEVVLARGAASVSGSVRNGNDQPAPGSIVTLIPEQRYAHRSDFYRYLVADDKGEFRVSDLRPGVYKIHAWETLERGAHQDAEFMRPFDSAGLTLTLQPAARESVQLGWIPGR
jgi:hypothetical protein